MNPTWIHRGERELLPVITTVNSRNLLRGGELVSSTRSQRKLTAATVEGSLTNLRVKSRTYGMAQLTFALVRSILIRNATTPRGGLQ
jgi:hypothetical protein